MDWISLQEAVCDTMKTHRSGRADRASGRCPAGESMLGGLNSPADFVSPPSRLQDQALRRRIRDRRVFNTVPVLVPGRRYHAAAGSLFFLGVTAAANKWRAHQ